LTTNTLALFDQNDKVFLTVENHKLSVLGQKLSVAIQRNQRVIRFLFLILKTSLDLPRRRAMQLSAVGGVAKTILKRFNQPVDNSQGGSKICPQRNCFAERKESGLAE
jgi:hypothetical protein